MCSILGIFDIAPGVDLAAAAQAGLVAVSSGSAIAVRTGAASTPMTRAILVHERLAIVDRAGGAQPLRSADGGLALAVNGEIYNHRELQKRRWARPTSSRPTRTAR